MYKERESFGSRGESPCGNEGHRSAGRYNSFLKWGTY
jgi:hypothetical protein